MESESPTQADPSPDADPETSRLRFCDALSRFLVRLGAHRPLVLLLEDLDFADDASLRLLAVLAPQLRDARLLVVATHHEAPSNSALTRTLAGLGYEPMVRRLALAGLAPSAVASLAAEATGTEPSPALVAALRERTGGNPSFLGELVRLLGADAGVEAVLGAVPAGVRATVRRRLARFPQATADLLALAATAGLDFDLATLARSLEVDEERVLELAEPALVGGMVVADAESPGRYRFSCALVRDTLCAELTSLGRASLHRRLGEAVGPRPHPARRRTARGLLHPVETTGTETAAVDAGDLRPVALQPV